MTLSETHKFIRRHEEIKEFCTPEPSPITIGAVKTRPRASSLNIGKQTRMCKFCGNAWHQKLSECPARKVTCHKCNSVGHYAKVCKSKKRVHHVTEGIMTVSPKQARPNFRLVDINGKTVRMLWDTGSSCTVISSAIARTINVKITHAECHLEAYDKHVMNCIGEATVSLKLDPNDSQARSLVVRIVECDRDYGLLGRDAMPPEVIGNCNATFLPVIKGVKASIKVTGDQPDVFSPARPVPVALKEAVSSEIEELVSKGVLVKAPPGSVSNIIVLQ